MAAFGRAPGTRSPLSTAPLLALIPCFILPPSAAAQTPTAIPATDSAGAVQVACRVVLSIPPATPAHRCVIERYRETAAEYVIRLRELPPPGGDAPVFPRSEVRLSKREPSVTVTRRPEL